MLAIHAIQEVAVVGLADQEWGQRVAAVVKFREGVRLCCTHTGETVFFAYN